MRNALTKANAAQLERERIIAEQQVLMDGYKQQSAALKTELANKRNRAPARLALPRDVALTMSGADGRRLRIAPAHLDDRKIRGIVIVGNIDLSKISSLLAVADHEEGQPRQNSADGPHSTPVEALKGAFQATSGNRIGAGEARATNGETLEQSPSWLSERDPAQRLPAASDGG